MHILKGVSPLLPPEVIAALAFLEEGQLVVVAGEGFPRVPHRVWGRPVWSIAGPREIGVWDSGVRSLLDGLLRHVPVDALYWSTDHDQEIPGYLSQVRWQVRRAAGGRRVKGAGIPSEQLLEMARTAELLLRTKEAPCNSPLVFRVGYERERQYKQAAVASRVSVAVQVDMSVTGTATENAATETVKAAHRATREAESPHVNSADEDPEKALRNGNLTPKDIGLVPRVTPRNSEMTPKAAPRDSVGAAIRDTGIKPDVAPDGNKSEPRVTSGKHQKTVGAAPEEATAGSEASHGEAKPVTREPPRQTKTEPESTPIKSGPEHVEALSQTETASTEAKPEPEGAPIESGSESVEIPSQTGTASTEAKPEPEGAPIESGSESVEIPSQTETAPTEAKPEPEGTPIESGSESVEIPSQTETASTEAKPEPEGAPIESGSESVEIPSQTGTAPTEAKPEPEETPIKSVSAPVEASRLKSVSGEAEPEHEKTSIQSGSELMKSPPQTEVDPEETTSEPKETPIKPRLEPMEDPKHPEAELTEIKPEPQESLPSRSEPVEAIRQHETAAGKIQETPGPSHEGTTATRAAAPRKSEVRHETAIGTAPREPHRSPEAAAPTAKARRLQYLGDGHLFRNAVEHEDLSPPPSASQPTDISPATNGSSSTAPTRFLIDSLDEKGKDECEASDELENRGTRRTSQLGFDTGHELSQQIPGHMESKEKNLSARGGSCDKLEANRDGLDQVKVHLDDDNDADLRPNKSQTPNQRNSNLLLLETEPKPCDSLDGTLWRLPADQMTTSPSLLHRDADDSRMTLCATAESSPLDRNRQCSTEHHKLDLGRNETLPISPDQMQKASHTEVSPALELPLQNASASDDELMLPQLRFDPLQQRNPHTEESKAMNGISHRVPPAPFRLETDDVSVSTHNNKDAQLAEQPEDEDSCRLIVLGAEHDKRGRKRNKLVTSVLAVFERRSGSPAPQLQTSRNHPDDANVGDHHEPAVGMTPFTLGTETFNNDSVSSVPSSAENENISTLEQQDDAKPVTMTTGRFTVSRAVVTIAPMAQRNDTDRLRAAGLVTSVVAEFQRRIKKDAVEEEDLMKRPPVVSASSQLLSLPTKKLKKSVSFDDDLEQLILVPDDNDDYDGDANVVEDEDIDDDSYHDKDDNDEDDNLEDDNDESDSVFESPVEDGSGGESSPVVVQAPLLRPSAMKKRSMMIGDKVKKSVSFDNMTAVASLIPANTMRTPAAGSGDARAAGLIRTPYRSVPLGLPSPAGTPVVSL